MNLQTWAEWVAQIDALTGGGVVELRAGPGKGMTIAVRWAQDQDGQSMTYGHALSMHEMKAMYGVVQPCVLESITHAVRKMTPNALAQGREPHRGEASPGATGCAANRTTEKQE